MRRVSTVLLLLVASAAAAGESRVLLSGTSRVDPDELLLAAETEIERCLRALDRSRENPAEAEYERQNARAAADDARFEMERLLLGKGYPNGRVDAKLESDGVSFEVKEGTLALLDEIIVESEVVEPGKLAELVRAPRTWLLGSRLLIASETDRGARKMVSWLRQQGYLRAEADGPFCEPELSSLQGEEQEVKVRYVVREGPRATLDSIRVTGTVLFEVDRIEDEFGDSIADQVGEPYGPITPYELQGIITGFYATRGHPYAEVTWGEPVISETETGLSVHLDMKVEEGPLVRFGRIAVEGQELTRRQAVRRELLFQSGDTFDSRDVADSRRNLLDTGLFGQVRVEIPTRESLAPGDPATVDATVHLEELKSRHLDFSIGFGSWDLLRAGVEMTWLNLTGMARTASVGIDASMRGVGATLKASDPWFLPGLFWDRTRATVELSGEQRERPTFTYLQGAAGITFAKARIAHLMNLSFGYRYSRTEVTEVSGDVPEEFEDTTALGILFVQLVRDARDDPWTPSRGSLLSGLFEAAHSGLLSDISFFRLRLRAVRYFPLTDGLTLVACAEAGAISPYGDTQAIPLQERFFLGGGESIRSFSQDDLGPRFIDDDGSTSDAASGGEYFSRLSLEFRYRIWGDLEGALFLDAGNVIQKVRDASLSDYRLGVGVGLRYRTPIGAVRLDIAANPSPRDYEDSWAIFFALGYPF